MDQTQAAQQQDFDIWEFVTCAKCQLSFTSDGVSGPSVPFWITECGHVLCNTHLNADQSCPSCNAQGIELMPLQKEMPPPFSDWFCSLPFKLDALAQAAKFQYERTAGAARYYKTRYEQHRALLNRMKVEVAQVKALRKEIEALKNENAQLRGGWNDQQQQQQHQQQHIQYQQEPAPYVNVNGKRRLMDNRISTSSPRSTHTPVGPSRITLPPDHAPPPSLAQLGASDTSGAADSLRQQPSGSRTGQPPGSSHFSQQYAYNPPQTPQMQMQTQQVLSHAQKAPIRQQMQRSERRLMPPPPTPAHIRQLGEVPQEQQIQRVATPRVSEQIQFNQGPPHIQVSRNSMQEGGQQAFTQNSGTGQFQSVGHAPRRFVPPTASGLGANAGVSDRRFVPSTPSGAQRRFVPSTPSSTQGRRFVPSSSSGARSARGPQGAGFGDTHAQRTTFAPSG